MGQESADKIFLTCCALHNWLLNENGLDKDCEDGVQSDWEGNLGLHDIQDVEHHIPDEIRRLMSRTALQSYDVLGMGYGSDVSDQHGEVTWTHNLERGTAISIATLEGMGTNTNLTQRIRKVTDLTLHYFRSKLISHF